MFRSALDGGGCRDDDDDDDDDDGAVAVAVAAGGGDVRGVHVRDRVRHRTGRVADVERGRRSRGRAPSSAFERRREAGSRLRCRICRTPSDPAAGSVAVGAVAAAVTHPRPRGHPRGACAIVNRSSSVLSAYRFTTRRALRATFRSALAVDHDRARDGSRVPSRRPGRPHASAAVHARVLPPARVLALGRGHVALAVLALAPWIWTSSGLSRRRPRRRLAYRI